VLALVTTAVSLALGTATAVAQTTATTPDPPSSVPPASSVPPTAEPPSSSTTTPAPTSTAAPATTTTTSPDSATPHPPADNVSAPTAAEAAAARAAFVGLSDDQRQLLRRLQTTRDALASARGEFLTLAVHLATAQQRLADADVTIRSAEADVAHATRALARLHGRLADLARETYRQLDRTVPFGAVNADDRAELNRARTYAEAPEAMLDTMVARDRATRRRLVAARAHAAQARADAAADRAAVQSALDRQREVLAATDHANTAALAAATAALGSGVSLLAQVADPHFGPDAITAALARSQVGQGEPVTLLGAFRVPVPGAPLGSPYGTRVDPITGSLGYHPGIDFEAPAGVAVHAAAAGTVVIAGDCGGYGNCVVIDHGHSLATVSAHLRQTFVTVGQPLAAGDVVGLVGSTGRSTGPHLHFEVRLHGVPIDPITTLTV
jgi:murein DD-endopeptidase MepM/ murein hydrolase activator NlpD